VDPSQFDLLITDQAPGDDISAMLTENSISTVLPEP